MIIMLVLLKELFIFAVAPSGQKTVNIAYIILIPMIILNH